MIIHAVFFYLIIIKFPIKVYTIEEEVVDVFIAPPVKMFIPGSLEILTSVENFIAPPPGKEFKVDVEFSEEEQRFIPESNPAAGVSPLSTEQSFPKISNNTIKNQTGSIPFDSRFSSGFKLGLPLDSKLDLSLNQDKIEDKAPEFDKGREKTDLNLSKYLYPGFSNIRSTKSTSSISSSRNGRPFRRGRPSLNTSKYNISPWAQKVVNKIQENWSIHSSQQTISDGFVGISVIIKKNGELLSFRIVNSSNDQSLDQAALSALKLSSPFPELPDDYPDSDLEVYFLFQYND